MPAVMSGWQGRQEKGKKMERIIQEAVRKLKTRLCGLAEKFLGAGLSPQALSRFESDLHESLGEVARTVEKAVLEASDIRRPAIEHEGRRHYLKYKGPQEYQCFFGKIEVVRSVYQANGERTMCPLELNAGIRHHHLTPLAAEFVAYSTAHMVPGELAGFCRRWQYLAPSETVIKQVAAEVGEVTEKSKGAYEKQVHSEDTVPKETAVVVISRDGTSVNVRKEGWREAQVGTVACYGPLIPPVDEEDDEHHERLRTVYLGQMPQEKSPSFNAKFEREVEHTLTNIPSDCAVLCLADGSIGIWNYFEAHPKLRDAVHILDFHHAAGYLAKVSHALYGEGTPEAKAWFDKYRKILKETEGGIEQVIRAIRYYRLSFGIRSGSKYEAIRDALRYFTRNRRHMHYAEYRRQGFPIGSGVVEAGCKTLVGQRLKRAGMRWSLEGGQAILNLRAVILSERWDAFWACHTVALEREGIAA
jgi:hypothetical protein